MYRITSQRGSWYSTEIATALPVADVKKSPLSCEGYLEFFSVFQFFSVFVQQFSRNPQRYSAKEHWMMCSTY